MDAIEIASYAKVTISAKRMNTDKSMALKRFASVAFVAAIYFAKLFNRTGWH